MKNNDCLGFNVRLVKGTFYKAILYGKKDRSGRYEVPEYEFFNAFMKVMTGKENIDTDKNQQNKIKTLKNCSGNSFKEELNPDRIRDRIRNKFDTVHADMRTFINDYCAPDRISSVVSILLSLIAHDETIEGLSFISSVRSDGAFSMVSKEDLLGNSQIDYSLLFLSLFEYTCRCDNKLGEETIDNWKDFLSSQDILSKYAGIADKNEDSIRRQQLLINNEVNLKEVDSSLRKTDHEAFCSQIEDNPELSRLGNDIERHWNLYVDTEVYRNALQTIIDLDYLMIYGAPGSGKTCTSEMIALKMAGLGYKIIYLYGFKQIKELYEDLTKSKERDKLFILIDDCMGQAFYELEKQDEASDLQNLVSYVKRNKEHIKLLMNSRANIINTAMKLRIGESILADMKATKRFIKAGELTRMEKARILLRHVVCRSDSKHYDDIGVAENRCLKVVDHEPFLPRVIDHVTRNYGQEIIQNNGDFFNQIINALDNPADVWKKIYEDNRSTPYSARILLEALFSLTNSLCEIDKCRNVFDHIVSLKNPQEDADSLWYEAIGILNESMITKYIFAGVPYISFYDPSVHDYLEQSIYKGQVAIDKLSKDIIYYSQVNSVYRKSPNSSKSIFLKRKTIDGSICNLLFDSFEEKRLAIIAQVCINGILMEEYKEYFYELFASKPLIKSYEWSMGDFRDFRLGILSCLLSSTCLRDFYVNKQLDADKFKYLTGNMNVKEACKILPYILNSKDALSFDFNEDKIYGFMSDAVSYSYSEYEDYFLVIDYPYSDYDISRGSSYINNQIYESCKGAIEDSDLPEEIIEKFIEVLNEYGEEDYTDEIKEYFSYDEDGDDDDKPAIVQGRIYDENSDEAILDMFSKPFNYYKELEEYDVL